MITFIVPCYNESENVEPLYRAFVEAFADSPTDWRLVMVDDGSRDETMAELRKLAHLDSRISVLSFSRNFGKEAAIYAGLNEAIGSEYIGIIDADLQQTPETARQMLEILLEDDTYDCVAAYQEERKESASIAFLKTTFYKIIARASRSQAFYANASDFRIFRNDVAQALLSMKEYHRFSKGLFSWVGFSTYYYPYVPDERNAGTSKWSLMLLIQYALEGIISFTTLPLHAVTALGLISSFLALIYVTALILKTLITGIDLPGYASVMALILLFGGAQLLAIGIMGEYLSRLYEQGKQRPIYVVRERINSAPTPADLD